MSELKPCPFCGELPIQFVKDGLTQIRCNNTQCWIVPATSFYTDRKTAVEAWEERAQPANDPLTLEQLRSMDGEPVWIESGDGAVCAYSGWAIVGRYYDDTIALYVPDNVYYEAAIRHGTVLAYRRPPNDHPTNEDRQDGSEG